MTLTITGKHSTNTTTIITITTIIFKSITITIKSKSSLDLEWSIPTGRYHTIYKHLKYLWMANAWDGEETAWILSFMSIPTGALHVKIFCYCHCHYHHHYHHHHHHHCHRNHQCHSNHDDERSELADVFSAGLPLCLPIANYSHSHHHHHRHHNCHRQHRHHHQYIFSLLCAPIQRVLGGWSILLLPSTRGEK